MARDCAELFKKLLASALADENNAWTKLKEFMAKNDMHVYDFDIAMAGVGAVGATVGPDGTDDGCLSPGETEQFVTDYLRREGIAQGHDGTLTWDRDKSEPDDLLAGIGRRPLTLTRVINNLRIEAGRSDLKLSNGLMLSVLAEWQENQFNRRVRTLFATIDHYPTIASDDEKARARAMLVEVCRLRFNDDPEFCASAIEQFVYQIKRKLLGLPVEHHLMLSLYSQFGGCGKSTFADRMLGPIIELKRNTDIPAILDSRNRDLWSSYVLYLDDVDETPTAQMGKFRRTITLPDWHQRIMRSGNSEKVQNNANMLASSNKRIYDLFPDKSGMRRYLELQFIEGAPSDQAISETDACDWYLIWRSVNPWGEMPIKTRGFWKALKARQESQRTKEPIEQWLDNFDPTNPSYIALLDADGEIKSADLWEHCYTPYAANNHGPEGRLSKDGFGKKLSNLIQAKKCCFTRKEGRNTTMLAYIGLPQPPAEAPTAPTPPTASTQSVSVH